MKRSDLTTKIVSAVLLAAILCYIGVSAFSSWLDPFRTTIAVAVTVRDGFQATGIAARSESVLTAANGTLAVTARTGEKLAVGGVVAKSYDADELVLIREAEELDARIDELQDILSLGGGDMLSLESDIYTGIYDLVYSVSSRDLTGLGRQATELEAKILSRAGGEDEIRAKLLDLRQRRIALGSVSLSGTAVTTPVSGVFSPSADGFETLTPDALSAMTVRELAALLEETRTPAQDAIGKVVTAPRWYFALTADNEAAQALALSGTAKLVFGRYLGLEVAMDVESVGSQYDDKCLVVFSSNKNLDDTLAVRKQTVEVIYGELNGIRVPRAALRLGEDGGVGVFVLSGALAERKEITVIYESDDYVVAEASDEAGALRAGDEIITTTKNIYDGKVVN